MIGYKIHGSVFWAVINFLVAPLSWIVWLIGQDVNLTIIKQGKGFYYGQGKQSIIISKAIRRKPEELFNIRVFISYELGRF